MIGAVVQKTGAVKLETMEAAVVEVLSGKNKKVVEVNKRALIRGAEYAAGGK